MSGEHRLNLQLDAPGAKETVDRARKELDASTPTPAPTKSSVLEEDIDPKDDAEQDAEEEVAEAAKSFVAGVDQITDVLLLILGKFHTTLQQQRLVMLFVVSMLGATFFQLYQQDQLFRRQIELEKQWRENVSKLDKLDLMQQRTAVSVEAVKQEAEKQPDISIVPDGTSGRAKVVIQTKVASKPSVRPAPAPMSGSVPAVDASTGSIEIPIALPSGSSVDGKRSPEPPRKP